MKKLLTIAGSDCSGGAGIQADLKTFQANNTYGMSVITALTAQNTLGVAGVFNTPREFVALQMDQVFQDIYPDGVKIGMVSHKDIIEEIAEKLLEYGAKNIVIDPVMVSTSGSNLMERDSKEALISKLLPLATIITPNMSEAGVLTDIQVNDKKDMEMAGRKLAAKIRGAVLIKGGHLLDRADDFLIVDGEEYWIDGEKIDNDNTHGTGCTLSSAIACNLAKGYNVYEAVKLGKDYITGAIKDNLNLGKGRGPLNHSYNLFKE